MVAIPGRSQVRNSLESDRMNLESFITEFYRIFFDLSPQVRPLFPTDTARLEAKMMGTLTHLAEALDSNTRLDAILRKLGDKHRGMLISDAHFESFIESFITALSRTLGPEWNTESQQAWDKFLRFVAKRMNYTAEA